MLIVKREAGPPWIRHDPVFPMCPVSSVLRNEFCRESHSLETVGLGAIKLLAQGSAGAKSSRGDEKLVFCLQSLHSYHSTQLLPCYPACLTPVLGAFLLGTWSPASPLSQTVVDVGAWYISKWAGLSISLEFVNFFKAYLTFVKPVILISTYIDHRDLQKVTRTSIIKFDAGLITVLKTSISKEQGIDVV